MFSLFVLENCCQVMDSDAEGVPSEFFDYFKVLKSKSFPKQILNGDELV